MGPDQNIRAASDILKASSRTTVFTGAGISVESGIPPFRGKGGLWESCDPYFIEIGYFIKHPEKSWKMIIETLYDKFRGKKPNFAHEAVSLLQKNNLVTTVITQNIDGLHQEAGSENVFEFHGNSKHLVCLDCSARYDIENVDLKYLPPLCGACGGVLKPDFVFFGEPVQQEALFQSYNEARESDVVLVIGTSGEVMPACAFPYSAKNNGSKIIELNTEPSAFTYSVSDVYIKDGASAAMKKLVNDMGFL